MSHRLSSAAAPRGARQCRWRAMALAVAMSAASSACTSEPIETPAIGSLGPVRTVATVDRVSDLEVTTAGGRLAVSWNTGEASGTRHVSESRDAGRSWQSRRRWDLVWFDSDVARDVRWQAQPRPGGYLLQSENDSATPLAIPTLGTGTTLRWAGADISGDLFSVWRGPADGQLRIVRHALAAQVHLGSNYLGIPVTLTRSAAPHSPVSAVAIPGGAAMTWIEARGSDNVIVLRIIGFDQLCGLPMPALQARATGLARWLPWK